MPEYEFRCKKCDQDFVIERSMSDTSAVACAQCGSDNISRIWNASVLSGKSSGAAAPASDMCASNPSKPKSCCPCG